MILCRAYRLGQARPHARIGLVGRAGDTVRRAQHVAFRYTVRPCWYGSQEVCAKHTNVAMPYTVPVGGGVADVRGLRCCGGRRGCTAGQVQLLVISTRCVSAPGTAPGVRLLSPGASPCELAVTGVHVAPYLSEVGWLTCWHVLVRGAPLVLVVGIHYSSVLARGQLSQYAPYA